MSPASRIVDVHAHLYAPEWYPSAFRAQIALGFLRSRGRQCTAAQIETQARQLDSALADRDGSITLRVMDRAGIECKMIHVIDWGPELGEPECDIRAIHQAVLGVCAKHSDRLIGFAGIDPTRADATEILRWSFSSLGASGLKLHPTSQRWTLRDQCVAALISECEAVNAAVMVHTGRTVEILSDRNASAPDLCTLARQFPSVSFIAGHSGWENWGAFAQMTDIPDNIFFDVAGWQGRLKRDAHNLASDIRGLVQHFGDRVLFGTDSPFYGYNLPHSEQNWILFAEAAVAEVGGDVDGFLSADAFRRRAGIRRQISK